MVVLLYQEIPNLVSVNNTSDQEGRNKHQKNEEDSLNQFTSFFK